MSGSRHGRFIVFEGGEGSGKDTQIAMLQESLADRKDIVYTREPGGTLIGERIRALLMSPEHTDMAVETELLLFLAARAQLMREVIIPAVEGGKHVICNRFGLSTIAYQIYRKERHEYAQFLADVSKVVVGDLMPHYILLDLDPEIGIARTRTRRGETTRFDVEPIEVHHRVRKGYHEAILNFPHVIVDSSRPLPEVYGDIHAHVMTLIAHDHESNTQR